MSPWERKFVKLSCLACFIQWGRTMDFLPYELMIEHIKNSWSRLSRKVEISFFFYQRKLQAAVNLLEGSLFLMELFIEDVKYEYERVIIIEKREVFRFPSVVWDDLSRLLEKQC